MNNPQKEQEAREKMQSIAKSVQEQLPEGWGFVVMAFPIGDKLARLNYVSNGKREDVLKLLKEFLYRNKAGDSFGKHMDTISPNDEN